MSFIAGRVNKAIEIEAEIERLRSLQARRTKAVGEASNNIARQIDRLESRRKALPPKRNSQTTSNDVAIWGGGTLRGAIYTAMNPNYLEPPEGQEQANFVVTHGGTLIANQAIIRGDGYFDNGYFSGDIYSENAYIKGEIHATSGTFNGKITSNANGNRIVIDPDSRELRMIDSTGNVLGRWYFFAGGSKIDLYDFEETDTSYNAWVGIRHKHRNALLEAGYLELTRDNGCSFYVDTFRDNQEGGIRVNISGLPTSKKNLSSGDLWRDGETIKIVP